jgi:hypothetical protein
MRFVMPQGTAPTWEEVSDALRDNLSMRVNGTGDATRITITLTQIARKDKRSTFFLSGYLNHDERRVFNALYHPTARELILEESA